MNEEKIREVKGWINRMNQIIELKKAGLPYDEEHEECRRDMEAALIRDALKRLEEDMKKFMVPIGRV